MNTTPSTPKRQSRKVTRSAATITFRNCRDGSVDVTLSVLGVEVTPASLWANLAFEKIVGDKK